MSDHLPECASAMIPDFHNERWVCICDALRACEQRVLRDAVNSDAVRGAIRIAEQRALDAAREAIRNREDGEYFPWVQVEIATAAIDALRGES